ncbi:hypothetical protein XELAEV_18042982mg [Xenopus laevis]|uniref:Uncharacterized protein n=1 Tax=Xenopus laevis TaxID=8355 RepID=A0A974C557_XENLA|nr:hypothetical protein XELAEV_18042982mg [Xenopus laevis]
MASYNDTVLGLKQEVRTTSAATFLPPYYGCQGRVRWLAITSASGSDAIWWHICPVISMVSLVSAPMFNTGGKFPTKVPSAGLDLSLTCTPHLCLLPVSSPVPPPPLAVSPPVPNCIPHLYDVSLTCVPYLYFSPVPVLLTCMMYLSLLPLICIPHLYPSPVSLTCAPHLYPSPVSLTCIPHLCPSPVFLTCAPHLYSSPVPLTCMMYSLPVPLPLTCAPYLYSSPVPLTCIPHLCPSPHL